VGEPSGVAAYRRLLLPDETAGTRRTRRDRIVDVSCLVVAAALGVGSYAGNRVGPAGDVAGWLLTVDWVFGLVSLVLLWWRRRHPVGVALLTVLLSTLSSSAAPASAIGLFTVSIHRRWPVVAVVGAVNVGLGMVFTVVRPQDMRWYWSLTINVAGVLVVTAWGLYVRARRQLVQTLRDRAERAESEQRVRAEQARLAERTRIAREMHDVLAHRISLLALHAGGLELRPDLPAEEVQRTAALLRDTAHRALEELRGVIGVLRAEDETAPDAPQPTLHDIPRLVDETREAGARIEFAMTVPDTEPPGPIGRDAYRIVQEALTNVTKHARGTATRVEVTGAPGEGLRIDVRNRLPIVATVPDLPGSGRGLVGLRERVTLSGGTLSHGPNDAGEFEVDARLTWPA
jgi:signal transduction histidine kinase